MRNLINSPSSAIVATCAKAMSNSHIGKPPSTTSCNHIVGVSGTDASQATAGLKQARARLILVFAGSLEELSNSSCGEIESSHMANKVLQSIRQTAWTTC